MLTSMTRLLSILIFVSLLFGTEAAQGQWFRTFPQGLGVEIGGGHNQLFWHVNPTEFGPATNYPRKELSFTPTVRVSYELAPLADVELLPFVGYDQFGGKSSVQSTGYKDEYWIYAIDAGLVGTYRFGDFALGPGFLYNRHIKKTVRSFGGYYQTTPRSWNEGDEEIFLKDFSYDVGARLSWRISHWSVAAEAWFGVSSLEKNQWDEMLNLRENHFRLLIGYRL